MNNFTLLERAFYTRHKLIYTTLEETVKAIRYGDMILYDKEYRNYTLKQAIEHMRKQPENEMQYWKARLLPAVAYNGTFSEIDRRI